MSALKKSILGSAALFILGVPLVLFGGVGRETSGPAGGGSAAVPAVMVSPRSPSAGGPVRVLAAFERPAGRITIELDGPGGRIKAAKTIAGGGPPYWAAAWFTAPANGEYRAIVRSEDGAARSVTVMAGAGPAKREAERGVWADRGGWTRENENLYSAWLEALFLETDERSSWPALNKVTENRQANLLHDHLGLGEDDAGSPSAVRMEPDCADNPFFLRAYFSWKMGLPFGFHECGWGSLAEAPRPGRWFTNSTLEGSGGTGRVSEVDRLLLMTANLVHAGSGRTALTDSSSDYYPVPLRRDVLRPGTVYADPYGHTLTIVRWIPQNGKTSGILLSVDAQPDKTIAIKRFWRGNFLFETRGVIGEPGFKHFRPIVIGGGRERLMTNDEIKASADYGDLSLEIGKMLTESFYDRMEKLIDPEPLDAVQAMKDLYAALTEQLLVRVKSVATGEDYMQAHPGYIVPMPPTDTSIFVSLGPWEDFSTPNRDLRVLIAIEAVLGFPAKAVAKPDLYAVPRGKSAESLKKELEDLSGKLAAETSITYKRSDGSPWKLTLAEVMARRTALEVAYNPNDSVEVRWGAPAGSEEIRTAKRRVPAGQRAKMESFRHWFRDGLHPPT